jgi:hypothetical protein
MAEVIGLVAAITELACITKESIKFLDKIKQGSKRRAELLDEAGSLMGLLLRLESRVEAFGDDPRTHQWDQALTRLLHQLKASLEELLSRAGVSSGSSHTSFSQRIGFVLRDSACQEILDKIGRVKSSIQIVLQEKTGCVT